MKRILAGSVLLALSAAGGYGYTLSERERSYRQQIADGDAALGGDNTFAAIESFSGAITLKPDAMLGYLKRGETYRRRGEFVAAIRDLRRASELDPTATRPLEELGDAYLADTPHRYGSAAERYEQYVGLDNSSPRVLYKLAFAKYHEGRAEAAIDAARRALVLDDKLAEAYYLLGLCYRDAQQPDAARKALEEAIRLQPTLHHAREELADLYGALDRVDARLNQLEVLTALDPGPSREVALGLAYARAGQTDRAVTTLARASERYPEQRYTYVALGRVWLEIAQARSDRVALSKAIGALEGAVGSEDSSEALTLFGRALLMASDAETAERMLMDATARKPVEPAAFAYLADAAERLSHFSVARQALIDYEALRGEAEPPRRAANAIRLADLSLRMNDHAAAAAYFIRAADGTDAALLTRAADAQVRAGDLDAARATVVRALEQDPNNVRAQALYRRLTVEREVPKEPKKSEGD